MAVAQGPLNQDAATFVVGVSQQTGLDPRVILAWMKAEGAYPAPPGTGGFNYLNVKPASGGKSYTGVPITVSPGGFERFNNVQDAISETVNRINQPFAATIRITRGMNAQQQITGIANSGWDTGKPSLAYAGKLQTALVSLFGPSALTTSQPPSAAPAIVATIGTGSANLPWFQGGVTGTAAQETQGATDAAKAAANKVAQATGLAAVGDFLGKLADPNFWIRVLQVIGGALLAGAGLLLLAKQIGLAASAPAPVAAVAGTVS